MEMADFDYSGSARPASSPPHAWLVLSRLPFMSVGIFPFITGLILADRHGAGLDWGVISASLAAVLGILLSTHWFGEYFDLEGDRINRDFNRFTGGSRVLVARGIVPRLVLMGAVLVLAAAGALGIWVVLHPATGPLVLPLGLAGVLAGAGYSVRPFRWAYRGLGEAMIGFAYGWLSINTGFYLSAGYLAPEASLASLPLAFSIMAVIVINEIPDYRADLAVGKRNLVVRLGVRGGARLYGFLTAAALVSMYATLPFLGPDSRLGFLLVPSAALAVLNLRSTLRGEYERPEELEAMAGRSILLNLSVAVAYGIGFAFL